MMRLIGLKINLKPLGRTHKILADQMACMFIALELEHTPKATQGKTPRAKRWKMKKMSRNKRKSFNSSYRTLTSSSRTSHPILSSWRSRLPSTHDTPKTSYKKNNTISVYFSLFSRRQWNIDAHPSWDGDGRQQIIPVRIKYL